MKLTEGRLLLGRVWTQPNRRQVPHNLHAEYIFISNYLTCEANCSKWMFKDSLVVF